MLCNKDEQLGVAKNLCLTAQVNRNLSSKTVSELWSMPKIWKDKDPGSRTEVNKSQWTPGIGWDGFDWYGRVW